jgi:hypothetical protein
LCFHPIPAFLNWYSAAAGSAIPSIASINVLAQSSL